MEDEKKLSFPVITKIMGRLMQLVGIVLVLTAIYYFAEILGFSWGKLFKANFLEFLFISFYTFLPLILGVLFISVPRFLFKRKKWAWFGSFILLVILAIIGLIGAITVIISYGLGNMSTTKEGWTSSFSRSAVIAVISISIPIIFFLDRRNFFKIAS